MTYHRLKWLAILAPIFFIGVLEIVHPDASGRLWFLLVAVVLIAAVVFYRAVFSNVDSVQQQLEKRNDELDATYSAGLDIVSELSLDAVLQKVVHRATELVGARFGAVAVYGDGNRIQQFVTAGVDHETHRRIGLEPEGKGLLGVVLQDGEKIRVQDIEADPRSCGLPANHPPMRSLLAVPLVCRAPFVGNIYLSQKLEGNGDFSQDDSDILERFAVQAAIAVDNAFYYSRVEGAAMTEERLRLAHEMHDGQAQVLAFVNTKAQAVRELLRAGRADEANEHLEQLAAAAREVYADVREGILGLRTASDAGGSLSDALKLHVERWQDQCGIAVDLQISELPPLATEVELQLLRILQEALANVRKHSGAQRAEVNVTTEDGVVRAVVRDEGRGFEFGAWGRGTRPRFGLATMQERAEAIGARLEITSQPGEGTRLSIELPKSPPEAPQSAPDTLVFTRRPEDPQ